MVVTHDELVAIYIKARKVIKGCKTFPQLYSAKKYAEFVVERVPEYVKPEVHKRLQELYRITKLRIAFGKFDTRGEDR